MKERILLLSLFISFISSPLFANFAKVMIVKGHVTQLAPGDHLARKVSKNDVLKIETSILTGQQSFVRMVLADGSVMFLGPNSKVVLNRIGKSANDRSVIGLLKGSLRNNIPKNIDGKMHFFVRTRTAAMGVRGTEFETVYGPRSGVTSLLTYKGSVSMVNAKEVAKPVVEKKFKYTSQTQTGYKKFDVVEEDVELSRGGSVESMERALNEGSASTVKAGQLSQTVDRLETVAKPVVINPVQLNLLYANDEFQEGKSGDPKANLEEHSLKIVPAPTDTPPEGIYDEKKRIYAPKSGGFFDRKTGVYIPPSKDALYDKKTHVYVDQEIGAVDAKTGEYIPPFGLEIDEVKGFVKKQFKPNTPKELLARVDESQQKLNSVLDQAIIVGDGPDNGGDGEVKRYLSYRELISKNVFWLNVSSFEQNFDISKNSAANNSGNTAKGAFKTTLGLGFDSGSRWKPYVEFSMAHTDFSKQNSTSSQSGKSLTGIGTGLKYSMAPHWNLFSQLKMDQQFVLQYTSTNNVVSSNYTSFAIPKLLVGVQGEFFRYKKLSGEVEARVGGSLGKSSGSISTGNGALYGLNLGLRYWPSMNWYLIGHIFTRGERYHVSGALFNYDVSRTSNGLTLGFGSYF